MAALRLALLAAVLTEALATPPACTRSFHYEMTDLFTMKLTWNPLGLTGSSVQLSKIKHATGADIDSVDKIPANTAVELNGLTLDLTKGVYYFNVITAEGVNLFAPGSSDKWHLMAPLSGTDLLCTRYTKPIATTEIKPEFGDLSVSSVGPDGATVPNVIRAGADFTMTYNLRFPAAALAATPAGSVPVLKPDVAGFPSRKFTPEAKFAIGYGDSVIHITSEPSTVPLFADDPVTGVKRGSGPFTWTGTFPVLLAGYSGMTLSVEAWNGAEGGYLEVGKLLPASAFTVIDGLSVSLAEVQPAASGSGIAFKFAWPTAGGLGSACSSGKIQQRGTTGTEWIDVTVNSIPVTAAPADGLVYSQFLKDMLSPGNYRFRYLATCGPDGSSTFAITSKVITLGAPGPAAVFPKAVAWPADLSHFSGSTGPYRYSSESFIDLQVTMETTRRRRQLFPEALTLSPLFVTGETLGVNATVELFKADDGTVKIPLTGSTAAERIPLYPRVVPTSDVRRSGVLRVYIPRLTAAQLDANWRFKIQAFGADGVPLEAPAENAADSLLKFTNPATARALTVDTLFKGSLLRLTVSTPATLPSDGAIVSVRAMAVLPAAQVQIADAESVVIATEAFLPSTGVMNLNVPADFFANQPTATKFVFEIYQGSATVAKSGEVDVGRRDPKIILNDVFAPQGWAKGRLFSVTYSLDFATAPSLTVKNFLKGAYAGAKMRFSLKGESGDPIALTQLSSGTSDVLLKQPPALLCDKTAVAVNAPCSAQPQTVSLLIPTSIVAGSYKVMAELLASDDASSALATRPAEGETVPSYTIATTALPAITVSNLDIGTAFLFTWPVGIPYRPRVALEFAAKADAGATFGDYTTVDTVAFNVTAGRFIASVPIMSMDAAIKFRLRDSKGTFPNLILAESAEISLNQVQPQIISASFVPTAPLLGGSGVIARGGYVGVSVTLASAPLIFRRQLQQLPSPTLDFFPPTSCSNWKFNVVAAPASGANVALVGPDSYPNVCEVVNGITQLGNRTFEIRLPSDTSLSIADGDTYTLKVALRESTTDGAFATASPSTPFTVKDKVFDRRLIVNVVPPPGRTTISPGNNAMVTWKVPDAPLKGMFRFNFDQTTKGLVFFGTLRDPEGFPVYPENSIFFNDTIAYDGGFPLTLLNSSFALFPDALGNVFADSYIGPVPASYIGGPDAPFVGSVYITAGTGAGTFDPAKEGPTSTPEWTGKPCLILEQGATLPRPCSRSPNIYLEPQYEVPAIIVDSPGTKAGETSFTVGNEITVRWSTLPIVDPSVQSRLNLTTTAEIWFMLDSNNAIKYKAVMPQDLPDTWFVEGDPDYGQYNVTLKRMITVTVPDALKACAPRTAGDCKAYLDSDSTFTTKKWVVCVVPKNGGASIPGASPCYKSRPFALRPGADVYITQPTPNAVMGIAGKAATDFAFGRYATYADHNVDVELRDSTRPRFSYFLVRNYGGGGFRTSFPFDPLNLPQGDKYYLRLWSNEPRLGGGRSRAGADVPVAFPAYDKVYNVRVNSVGPDAADTWTSRPGRTVNVAWTTSKREPTNMWIALCTNQFGMIGRRDDGGATNIFRTFGLPSANDGSTQKCVRIGIKTPETIVFLFFRQTLWNRDGAPMQWSQNYELPTGLEPGNDYYVVVGFDPATTGTALAEIPFISRIPAPDSDNPDQVEIDGITYTVNPTHLARSRAGTIEDAGLASYNVFVSKPSSPITFYIGSRVSLDWTTQGPKTSAYKIKVFGRREGSSTFASLTPTAVALDSQGSCDSSRVCTGSFTWTVPENLPAGTYRISYRLVTSAGAETGRNSGESAQVTVSTDVPRTITEVRHSFGNGNSVPPKTELTVGEAITASFYASFSMAPGVADIYLAASCDAAPADVALSGANGVNINKYLNTYTFTVPVTTVVLPGCGSTYYLKVVSRASGAFPSISARTAVQFTVKPSRGAIVYELPAAGASYSTGQTFSVRFVSAGLSNGATVTIRTIRVDGVGAPVLLNTSAAIALSSTTGGGAAITASIPRSWLGGAASATLRVTATSTGAEPIVSTVDGIALSLPNNRLLTGVLSDGISSTALPGERSFKLGSQLTASWTYTGFPSTARINGYVFSAQKYNTNGFRVQGANSTAFTNIVIRNGQASFTVPGGLDAATKYLVAFMMVGYAPNVDAGTVLTTPVFAVSNPLAGVLVSEVAPLNSDAFVQGGRLSVVWNAFGEAGGADKPYRVVLDNSGVPGFTPLVIASSVAATDPNFSLQYQLADTIDISAAMANKYFVRVEGISVSTASFSAVSGTITVVAPRVGIRINSPSAGERKELNPGLTFSSEVTVTGLGDLGDQIGVTVFLKNLKVPAFAFPGTHTNMTSDKFLVNFTLSDSFPETFPAAFSSSDSFYVEVRSKVYTSIGGVSSRFTVARKTKSFCFNTKATQDAGRSPLNAVAACVPDTMQTGWMALLKPDNFTLYYSSSGAIAGEGVRFTIKNARDDNVNLLLPPVPALHENDYLDSFTFAPGTLSALSDSASIRSWYYIDASLENGNKIVRSPYFTLASQPTLFVTEPTATRSVAQGKLVTVRWEGAALSNDNDNVEIQFVNPVLAKSGELQTVPFGRKSFDITVPSDAAIHAAWAIKVSVKGQGQLFSTSANLRVVAATPAVRITTPSSSTTVQLGEPLSISWEALNFNPLTKLSLTLRNSMPDMADFSQTIVENLDPAQDTSYVWMVPRTVSAAAAIRSAYYVQVRSHPDDASGEKAIESNSPAFTLTNTDLAIAITNPAPEDVVMPGSDIRIAWGVRKVEGMVSVTLTNSVLRASIPVDSASFTGSSLSANGEYPANRSSVTARIPSTFVSAGSSASQWFVSVVSKDFPAVTARAGPFAIQQVGAPLMVNSPSAETVAPVGSLLPVSIGISADGMQDASFNRLAVTLLNRQLDTFAIDLTTSLSKQDAASAQSFLLPRGVPLSPGVKSQYFIRVQSASVAGGFYADSDPFTLSQAAATISLSAPSKGVTLVRGEVLSVAWTYKDLAETAAVTVELLNPALGVKLFLAEAQAADGTVSVAIPKRLALPQTGRDQFTVRVSARGGAVTDESPRFKISPPPARIKVTTPPPNSKPVYNNWPMRVVWLASNIPADAAATLELVSVSSAGASTLAGTSMTIGTGTDLEEAVAAMALRDNANPADLVSAGAIDFEIPNDAIPSRAPNGVARRWKLRIRLADDVEVFGESATFEIAEPRTGGLEPPIIAIPAAIRSGGLTAGAEELTFSWTHPGGYAVPTNNYKYKFDLMCFLPESPELPTKIVSITTMPATQTGQSAAFVIPGLAVSRYPVLSSCLVQAQGEGEPYGASEVIAQSSKFSVYKPPLVIELLRPNPALPFGSVQPSDDQLPAFEAGALFPVGWRYAMSSGDPLPEGLAFDDVKVQLWRRGSTQDNGAGDVFVVNLPVGAMTNATNTTAEAALPLSAPFGVYYVTIVATFSGGGVPLATTSSYFRIKPTGSILEVLSANSTLVAGQAIRVVYKLAGVSATNEVRIALRSTGSLDSAAGEIVLAAATQATGMFKAPVPLSIVAGAYKVRVSLVQDPTLFALAPTTTSVSLPASFISVELLTPAQIVGGRPVTWVAGSTVEFKFTAVGMPSDCSTVNITLMQDRYYLSGGDKAIAIISGAQPLAQTTVKWIVPADLPSWAPTYVRVQAVSASLGDAAPKGVSEGAFPITLKSAPPKALVDWTESVCREANAGATNLAYLPAFKLPFCKTFCSACVANGGSWVTGASVAVDFTLPNWPGTLASLNALKSGLGAFSSAGASLCVPNSVLAAAKASASDPGVFEMHFKDIPGVNAQLSSLTGGKVTGNLTVDLALVEAFSIYDNCNAVRPMVAGTFTVLGECADPTKPDRNAEIIAKATLEIANKTGVDPSAVRVTLEPCGGATNQQGGAAARRRLSVAAAGGLGSSAAGTMLHHTNSYAVHHASMARRLLTHDPEHPNALVFDASSMQLMTMSSLGAERRRRLSGSTNGGGSYTTNTNDDGSAQNGGDSSGGTGYTGSSLQGNDAGSGVLAALYALIGSGGLGGDGGDFFTYGDFQLLAQLAAAREAGAMSDPAPTTNNGTPVGAIIGGVIGAIAGVILIAALVVWGIRKNKRDSMIFVSYEQVSVVGGSTNSGNGNGGQQTSIYGQNPTFIAGTGTYYSYAGSAASTAPGAAANNTRGVMLQDDDTSASSGLGSASSSAMVPNKRQQQLAPHASGLALYASPRAPRGNANANVANKGKLDEEDNDAESEAALKVDQEISPLVSSPSGRGGKGTKHAFV